MTSPTWTMPPEQLVTNSVIAALRTFFGNGVKVGDHEAPTNPTLPYAIVYSIPGGNEWGGFSEPEASAGLPYQVSCVGERRDQAQWLADRMDQFFLETNSAGVFVNSIPFPTGWVCCGRLGEAASSGLLVEGTSKDRRFTAPKRYTLQATPA